MAQVEGPEGRVLDMDRGPDRLWSLELAALRQAALKAAAARVHRSMCVAVGQTLLRPRSL